VNAGVEKKREGELVAELFPRGGGKTKEKSQQHTGMKKKGEVVANKRKVKLVNAAQAPPSGGGGS